LSSPFVVFVIIIMVMVAILIIVPVVISSNPAVDEGRKRVLGIMAAILASLHLWLREPECTYAGELIIYLGLFDPNTPRPAFPAKLERKLAA
jgi:hypothetical protein